MPVLDTHERQEGLVASSGKGLQLSETVLFESELVLAESPDRLARILQMNADPVVDPKRRP